MSIASEGEASTHSRWGAGLRDFTAYVLISVVGFALLVFCEIKYPDWFEWKWIAFALNTAFLCGYVVHWFRDVWRLPKFWLILFLSLILHGLGFILVLRGIDDLPLIWYALLVPVELLGATATYRRLGIYPR